MHYREKMLEAVAEFDDHLLEKFLDGGEINSDEILLALRRATIALKAVPVTCGSAFRYKGVQRLLDAIVTLLPSPVDVPPVAGTVSDTDQTVECEARGDAPFASLAFKVMTDPFVGRLTFLRVYLGDAPRRLLRL